MSERMIVAMLAAGAMGSAVAQRLTDNGVEVLTSLDGRSAATRERAAAAGMVDVPLERLAEAELVLSIVPPAEAVATAERLAPFMRSAGAYADCNAVSPATARHIETILAPTGGAYIDASIIGPPPKPGVHDTVFYASGPQRALLQNLNAHGLDVRLLNDEIGAASALKMSYAGITKGLTGLAAAMLLAAARGGASEALREELARSQPGLLEWFARQLPGMLPKAYRWDGEMQEIAAFCEGDAATADIYDAMARLYRRIAADVDGPKAEASIISGFFSARVA